MANDYFYFGLNMFSFPDGRKESEIKKLTKHYSYSRYILKQKYRAPGGHYATMVQKIGELIYEIMESLDCK